MLNKTDIMLCPVLDRLEYTKYIHYDVAKYIFDHDIIFETIQENILALIDTKPIFAHNATPSITSNNALYLQAIIHTFNTDINLPSVTMIDFSDVHWSTKCFVEFL